MATFYSYLPLLQQVEGGFQKNPDDPGNYNSRNELVGTNYGISARFYEGVIGRPPTEADMRGITKNGAERIFRDFFWDDQHADQIRSQAMANTIIDHQVNAGNGAKLAQQVLNRHFGFNVSVDNQIGPQTLSALNSVDPSRFVNVYNDARADHYRQVGNPTFLAGWLQRLKKFTAGHEGISMLAVVSLAVAGLLIYYQVKS